MLIFHDAIDPQWLCHCMYYSLWVLFLQKFTVNKQCRISSVKATRFGFGSLRQANVGYSVCISSITYACSNAKWQGIRYLLADLRGYISVLVAVVISIISASGHHLGKS